MEIGALIRLALNTGAESLLQQGVRVQPGDRLELKVVEVRPDQRALVDFGGVRALAEVAFPVAAGQSLTVEVLETEGRLRLGVVRTAAGPGGAAAPAEPLRACAAETLTRARRDIAQVLGALDRPGGAGALPAEARQALARLEAALAPVPLAEGPAAAAARIEALCTGSGLFLEKRLGEELARLPEAGAGLEVRALAALPAIRNILGADLKALLAEVGDLLGRGAPPLAGLKEAAALSRSVEALASEIGRGQEDLARRRAEPELLQVTHFTLPLGDGRSRAALKIGFRKPAGGRPREGARAALLLEFDRLGPTRIDLFALDKTLAVAFYVSTPDLRQAVAAYAGEIETALAAQFDAVRVEVRVSPEKIAAFETEELLPAEGRRLDVHA
jgi:hypothetical protein